MNKELTLTPSAFSNLLSQLLFLEENKKNILDDFFPRKTKEKIELEELIDEYVKKVDQLIKNIKITDESENVFPFVSIGSIISIKDTETHETYQHLICNPYNINTDNSISYLSPMGRALLLKCPGDKVSVNTPSGVYNYVIESITFN
ncbi:transcription elongation factor GreA [Desulfotomaculum arcticum]|uniref:Transcription elongation factor GreA n=1 Tax=Desulfotruncus arcticus DSM 17038 TaxID=1121424 RepID=A0A1I2U5E2_9FIRM|nr:GreA/GreB family elongation factor [Desulfotruncus arcticus]SFG72375.1 transcription elongation factor GreA [Desulfotomaculum arcticum] [Desulfotruncus arcticus DSM 17038]